MKSLQPDHADLDLIFLHSKLDEYGLDLHEFRLYAHLKRRANGKRWANPGIASMSKICGMKRNTVVRTIRSLEVRCMIRVTRTTGGRNEYILTHPSEWEKPGETSISGDTGIPNNTSIPLDTGVVSQTAPPPVSPWILKGNPKEGNPLKDNTVAAPSSSNTTPADSPNASSQNILEPCGRFAPPKRYEPALSRQHAGGNSPRVPFKPSQTPIQRKAYAIAALLRFRHWDNCKVSFAKHTARAYAETALEDGHDEQVILENYETALRYCHGVVTDEICRGERRQHERASLALTVWLARKRLNGDPQTDDERWQAVIAKLTTEQRKSIEEDAMIREEIEAKAPAIKAWFANSHNRDGTSDREPMPEAEPKLAIA